MNNLSLLVTSGPTLASSFLNVTSNATLVLYIMCTTAAVFVGVRARILSRCETERNREIRRKCVRKELTQDQIEPLALRRWRDVLVWVTFSPDELLWQDKKKQSILHHAILFQAPVEVIELITLQAPELANTENEDGEVPLHWAIRLSMSNQIIRTLLSVSPSSGVYARDKDGNTPLSLLWERHQDSLLRLWWTDRSSVLKSPSWNRIVFLMRCNYFGQTDNLRFDSSTGASDLHIIASCPCPPALFPLALRIYRNKLNDQDEMGRTPLASACSDAFANRYSDVSTKIDLILSEHEGRDSVGIPDAFGRLSFFAALEAGVYWDEGIQRFFEIDSSLISLKDSATNLYPFLLAACSARPGKHMPFLSSFADHSSSEDTSTLNTIYSLLRADPTLACNRKNGPM